VHQCRALCYSVQPPIDNPRVPFSRGSGHLARHEHACGFDRSQLLSDEGPPIGELAADPWAEAANHAKACGAPWARSKAHMRRWNLTRGALSFCVSAALLEGCGGSQPPSTSLPPQIAAPQSAGAGSPLCSSFCLRVRPRRSTIRLGQQITLHDVHFECLTVCFRSREDAVWSSSGGSLQVLGKGRRAILEVAPVFWTRNRPFLCDDLADYAAFSVG
jgi:hypothetical protein